MENAIHKEYADQVQTLFRFLERTNRGSFYFAVSNDEKLQREVSNTLQFLALGKDKKVLIFNWDQQVASIHPLQLLKSTLAAHPETSGLILLGNDTALRYNPAFFTQLNFSREALLQLGIPILFWLSKRTLALLNQQALDIYNQRAGTNVYFEYAVETTDPDQWADRYVVREVLRDNEELGQYEARIELLQEQLREAETQQIPKTELVNGIVIDLLELYAKIPGTATLVQRLLDDYAEAFDDNLPRTCFVLGVVYSYLKNISQAQTYYKKALKLNRKLIQSNPENLLPRLAATLNNLALLHVAKNEFKLAENAYREAIGIYRELINTSPSFLSDMAATLNNLGELYRIQNHLSNAQSLYEEALGIFSNLARVNSQDFLRDVAMTLNNLAVLQAAKNEYELAENTYQETLSLNRKLAQKNPQIFLPDVAKTLNNLAGLLKNKNKFGEAEIAYSEALDIYRKLGQRYLQTFLPDIAQVLSNLGNVHVAKNEFEQAESEYREALSIQRELAHRNPQTFLPDVANTLNNLVALFGTIGKYEIAEEICREALDIRRKLADSNPEVFLPYVASTLNNLAILYKHKNKFDLAGSAYNEALLILRELAKKNPQVYLPKVAMTAANLSIFYQDSMPDKERSMAYAKEALWAAQPFVSFLPAAKINAENARKVITDWGEDPDTFLRELVQENEGA